MAVSGSAGTYAPNRKKKHRRRQGGLKPIGGKPGKFGKPTSTGQSGLKPIGQKPPGAFGPASATAKPPGASNAPVQPLDPNLENQKIIGQRDVALSDVYSAWSQNNLDAEYGFGAGAGLSPYTKAAQLQENYKRSVLGTTGSYANAGQYNSGAYGRAQNENARNYDMAYDAARRAYDQASGNLQFNRLQTYANAGTAVDEATYNAMLKAMGGL